jgi:hypothetical protein
MASVLAAAPDGLGLEDTEQNMALTLFYGHETRDSARSTYEETCRVIKMQHYG